MATSTSHPPPSPTILDRALQGERITDEDALVLLRSRDLVAVGPRRRRAAQPQGRPRRGHVHRRPEHQLHQRLRHRLRLLRLLPAPRRPARGLRPAEAGDLQEDRGDAGDRRHRRADAGRPPPRPRHRLVRGPVPLDQGALPDPPARALAAGDPAHRAPLAADGADGAVAACATPGSTRCPAAAARCSSTACARIIAPKKTKTDEWLGVMRHAHRLGMSTSATMMYGHVETVAERVEHMRRIRDLQDEAPRLPRLHLVDVPARRHAPRRADRHETPTSFDYLLTQAVSRHLPRQRRPHPVVVGHAGPEDRPGRAPLRRRRPRLDDDRGERRLRRGHDLPRRRSTTSAASSAPSASGRCSATRCTAACAVRLALRRRGPPGRVGAVVRALRELRPPAPVHADDVD